MANMESLLSDYTTLWDLRGLIAALSIAGVALDKIFGLKKSMTTKFAPFFIC